MDFSQFSELARSYNVIPVCRTILADTLTPVSAYLRLRKSDQSTFLFESVEGGERFARYSFIGCNTYLEIECNGSTTTITENGIRKSSSDNFFDILHCTTKRFHQAPVKELTPFSGGLVGYIGYDAVRFIEHLPSIHPHSQEMPESKLGLFTTILAFDHLKQHITIIHNVILNPQFPLRQQFTDGQKALDDVESLLDASLPSTQPFRMNDGNLRHETTPEEFVTTVHKAKEHIVEGDIFQVVLSQRLSVGYAGDTFNLYRALRRVNPSPYLYFVEFDGTQVIGSSPEILVRKEGALVETYPIAGTRPRGQSDHDDLALENELLADEKERAEHIMLVDLGRNDLGRVCKPGSVKVEQLMKVVRYSHVMHMASRVTGETAANVTAVDVLKSAFPAGTVSGAPKIRAMEIIDRLEPYRRGLYAGGIGYLGFSGSMDMCIAIRTMYAHNNRIYLQAGAGIVADSIPENEYQEMLNKAQALIEALRLAETIR